MKKLLIINGSPRKKGCDARVCEEISRLASKYGYESETVWAYDLDIRGCRACMACKSTQKCVQKDCMNDILDKIKASDMLLFATPVYFNGVFYSFSCVCAGFSTSPRSSPIAT